MMWSITLTSSNCNALTILSVSCLSCPLGVVFPDGWLCANTTLEASESIAYLAISFVSAVVCVIPP